MSRGRKESCTGQLVTAGRALQPTRACSALPTRPKPAQPTTALLLARSGIQMVTDTGTQTKGQDSHLLLDALCTEQRGKFSITGHLNHWKTTIPTSTRMIHPHNDQTEAL